MTTHGEIGNNYNISEFGRLYIDSEGILITFEKIVVDRRCPIDALCFVEDKIGIEVKI